MIKLIPMNAAEFEPFMQLSMRDQAEGQVQAGRWQADEAEAQMRQLREQFLPAGLQTPGHYFFTLMTEDEAQKVGALWFAVMEQEGEPMLFVLDIQVYPEYRQRGYGSQAFRQMEAQAVEMGLSRIALHVFKHNTPARKMYEKLGYVSKGDEAMFKEL